MKNTTLSFLFILILGLLQTTVAQKSAYTIKNSHVDFQGDKRSCVHVEVDPGLKLTKKAWENFLKEKYDIKMKGKLEMQAKEVRFVKISPAIINFYTIISGDESFSHIDLLLSFDKKNFARPENNPSEFENMKLLLEEFLPEFLKDYYVSEIKASAKDVKKARKAQKKLVAANKKLTKQIAKNSKTREKLDKSENTDPVEIAEIDETIAKLMVENQEKEQKIQENSSEISRQKEIQFEAQNRLDLAVSKLKLLKKK